MHNSNDNSEENEDHHQSPYDTTDNSPSVNSINIEGGVGHVHIGHNIVNYAKEKCNQPKTYETSPEINEVDKVIHILCDHLGSKWSEFAEKIGLGKDEIDDIREEYCGGSADKAMSEMAAASLKNWRSSDLGKKATCDDLISALKLIGSYDIIEKLERC